MKSDIIELSTPNMATTTTLDTTVKLLAQLPLFSGLPGSELAALAQSTHFEQYAKDTVIFHQGDECDRVWIVRTGRIKIIHIDMDGREVILEIISPGEPFGGAVLFFPQHPATAIAMENSSIASFSREVYSRFLLDHAVVALKLIKMVGVRHLSMLNLQIMAGERVEYRMAHILLKLADRAGKQVPEGTLITIPLSRQDLADMACTTLETAIRTLSRFRKEGLIITHKGGYLVIRDEKSMQRLAGN